MATSRWHPGPLVVTAMVGAAVVGAQYVAGKAARDALFLANFDTSSLPSMVIATSMMSIALVVASSRRLVRVSPGTYVPVAFAASAILLLVEWGLTSTAPGLAARILYLQISGFGPLLGSGFWLIASERFDPHTAKKRFGQIAAAGTLGGLIAGLLAARVATLGDVGAMLPLVAALNLACAWQIRRLARAPDEWRRASGQPARTLKAAPAPATSGWRILAETPYLRNLAALVLVGTMAAIFLDQVFKTQVKAVLGPGASLGSFFALYYASTSLVTFVVQTWGSRIALEKLGLAAAAGAPSITLLAGSAASLLLPGFTSLVATRGSETVVRGSLYRAGYELFFTPVGPRDKRAVKSVIDVGFDRTGDIVGAGLIQSLLWLPQPRQTRVLLGIAMACSAVGLWVASRLRRGYLQSLERSLLNRAVELDLSEVEDLTTRTAMLRTLRFSQPSALPGGGSADAIAHAASTARTEAAYPEIPAIGALRSRDSERILAVLRGENGLSASLVPHVVPLLAWDPVAFEAVHALRTVAEERVGELTDALLDPNQEFAVRRRLARVFSVCVSQRAADGLLLGLEDLRFEVRFQCGRSLLAIAEKSPSVRIDQERVFAMVRKEVAVNSDVWTSRKLLDAADEGDTRSFLDELVRARASQSLAHVFTLLALVLPTEPLHIAFRGLHTSDQGLRGTALEYLEGALPSDIRERLWPFLEDRRTTRRTTRPSEELLADLLRSRESIAINLEQLRRRSGARPEDQAE